MRRVLDGRQFCKVLLTDNFFLTCSYFQEKSKFQITLSHNKQHGRTTLYFKDCILKNRKKKQSRILVFL